MEFLKDLLNATLLPVAVAIAILLQVLKNLWTNAIKGEIPRYADPALAVAALAASCFFVWRWHFYLPTDQPPSLLSDVPMQTAILWIGTIFSHFILRQVYGSGRPVGTADELRATIARVDPIVVDKAGVTVTDTKPGGSLGGIGVGLIVGVAMLSLLGGIGCGVAHAQPSRTYYSGDGTAITEPDSSIFAVWRLGVGVTVQAAALQGADGERFTAFLPGALVSYSWTADLSTSAGFEGDPASSAAWANAGVRLRTYKGSGTNPLSLYLGADYVWPNDKARERLGLERSRHAELSVRVATPVARRADGSTVLFAVGSSRWSPDERLTIDGLPRRRAPEYSLGLRWVAWGGR